MYRVPLLLALDFDTNNSSGRLESNIKYLLQDVRILSAHGRKHSS